MACGLHLGFHLLPCFLHLVHHLLLHLLDSLKLRLGDVVWLVVPNALYAQYESTLDLAHEFPDTDIRVITFDMKTRGAVETCFVGLQHMSDENIAKLVDTCDVSRNESFFAASSETVPSPVRTSMTHQCNMLRCCWVICPAVRMAAFLCW